MKTTYQYIGVGFVGLSLAVLIYVLFVNSRYSDLTRTFSPYSFLHSSWQNYKQTYLNQDGRVIDYSLDGITTSEGQSYAMLRSVWVDDKTTFDAVWKWTVENLKRKDDNLFGWKWGKKSDGSYGLLPDGGENSASDAESDIALALIMAGNRWDNRQYTEEAKKILKDLWDKNTAVTDTGKRYLIAGNWAQSQNELVVNPSYLSPYAYRMFAIVDRERDWSSLIDPTYELLNQVGFLKLDKEKGVGLPPNWISIDRKTGEFKAPGAANLTTDYGFDAIRTPFRIAIDYLWFDEKRAYEYLQNSYAVLAELYEKDGKLYSEYYHDGKPKTDIEGPAMYATAMGYFSVVKPELAKKISEEKIVKLYSNDTSSFNKNLPYYEQNWLWFGYSLYSNQLRKL